MEEEQTKQKGKQNEQTKRGKQLERKQMKKRHKQIHGNGQKKEWIHDERK